MFARSWLRKKNAQRLPLREIYHPSSDETSGEEKFKEIEISMIEFIMNSLTFHSLYNILGMYY